MQRFGTRTFIFEGISDIQNTEYVSMIFGYVCGIFYSIFDKVICIGRITLSNKLLIQGPYVGYPKIVALDLIIDTDHFLRQTTQLYFDKNIPRQAYDGTK